MGCKTYIVNLEGAYVSKKDGVDLIHNIDDDKGFKIHKSDTIVTSRASITSKDSYLDLLSQIEQLSIQCVNSRETTEICTDKYRTFLTLKSAEIEQPKTVLISVGKDKEINYAEKAFEKLETKFPVILKTLRGTQGVGVMMVESLQSLEALVQLLYKMDENVDLLLQEFIKSEFDVRVMVLNDEIIGTMRRNVPKKDFRSNYSQGATTEKYELSEKEKETVLNAAKAVGGYWTGVDFIPNNGNPLVIEVNSSAGTEGIEGTTGTNLNKVVVEYISNKENWNLPKITIGVKEHFFFPLFGAKLDSKMDTGNSSQASVIHGDDIKLSDDNKKVTWKFRGKIYRAPVVEMKSIITGGNSHSEERPVILLDVKFNDIIHKNIQFTLDNRIKKTDVLCNKEFMINNSLIIDPELKYTLS